MKKANRRLVSIAVGAVAIGLATALVLNGLKDTIVYFYSPSDVKEKGLSAGTQARLGGLVQAGSLIQRKDGSVTFVIRDNAQSVPVTYRGLLPDLFREGQGVVAEGVFTEGGSFTANRILAKHDENYMPKEVVEALKRSGEWRPESGMPPGAQPAATAKIDPSMPNGKSQ